MAILFAQSTLGAPKFILLGGAVIVPLFAGLGNWIWTKVQTSRGWTNKKVLLLQNSLFLVLPFWGLVGFFTGPGSFGLQNKYELLIVAAYHGLLLGATQSTCRVFYSELIPRGHEAQFFGLYEITDKGSAWIGPLVVGAIATATGNIRYSFIFIFVTFLVSIGVFTTIDVKKGREQAQLFVSSKQS